MTKALVTLILTFSTLTAHASQVLESVQARATVSLLVCRLSGGGRSCTGGGPIATHGTTLELKKSSDGNNSNGIDWRTDLEDGTILRTHLFVNKLTHESSPGYIVTLTVYGYAADGKSLFPMTHSSVQLKSLEDFKSFRMESIPFSRGDKANVLVFEASALDVKK